MVILYSNHCPLCNRLKEVLDGAKIDYKEENDLAVMDSLGIDRTPQLGVDIIVEGEERRILLKYPSALKWVNDPEYQAKLEQECTVNG